ncbi:hypothetical protein B0H14DRAFT_2612432 [Mycena olivaceomarginata]|nr:hypothetical protein B0H14DRAFT_2612432 [Mycena olivaceomarginata]
MAPQTHWPARQIIEETERNGVLRSAFAGKSVLGGLPGMAQGRCVCAARRERGEAIRVFGPVGFHAQNGKWVIGMNCKIMFNFPPLSGDSGNRASTTPPPAPAPTNPIWSQYYFDLFYMYWPEKFGGFKLDTERIRGLV